jgi:hypothetical protein
MAGVALRRLSLDITANTAGDPLALRDRIAAAARRDLPRGLASLAVEGGPLVHIRRLDVDMTAIGDVPPERIGIELGRRIAEAVERLAADPDERTVVFASPAARTAAYVSARLSGDGAASWWFSAFEGLALLSAPTAVATALAQEAEELRATLRLLDPQAAARLPNFLGPRDALRLIAAIIGDADDDAVAALDRLAPIAAAMADEDPALRAAAIIMAACREDIDLPVPAIAAAANLLAGMAGSTARAARRTSGARTAAEARVLRRAPLPDTAAALLRRLPQEALEQVQAQLRRAPPHATVAVVDDAAQFTLFANLALLWPFIDALPVHRVHGGLRMRGIDAGDLTRFLILATVAGPDAAGVFADPVWREVFGLPPGLGQRRIRRALRAAPPATPIRAEFAIRPLRRREAAWLGEAAAAIVGPDQAHRLVRPALVALRSFARRLPGFGGASVPFLASNLLKGAGHLRQDGHRITVEITRPPLDVMLSMTRLADRDVLLLDGRVLVLRRGRAE